MNNLLLRTSSLDLRQQAGEGNAPLQHIAIVMDGNGRWAKQRNLPRVAGHQAGLDAVKRVIEYCQASKIKVLTLFALSVENFSYRPLEEVQLLMSLFLDSLQRYAKEMHENNIRLQVIGDRSNFNLQLQQVINEVEQQTAQNTALTLVIALNYSGRWDILQATRRLANKVEKNEIVADEITAAHFQCELSLGSLPEPDLLIRTSGEQRISNFMLWQFAYTELFFSEVYWPDFDKQVFDQALAFFRSRQRRFGQTTEQIESQYA